MLQYVINSMLMMMALFVQTISLLLCP